MSAITRRVFVSAIAGLCALLVACPSLAQDNRIRDVIYGKKLGVALTLDVFKPEKPNGIGVIWMVSGGWVSNHNNINAAFAKPFNDKGMTVFEVVHGTQPKFQLGEIVGDIHRAVRFIRTNAAKFGVDPNRLAISGASAGGHLSLMMGSFGSAGPSDARDEVDRASSAVQAVACFFPPTDFLNYGKAGASAMKIATLKGYWPAFGVTDQTPDDKAEAIGKQFSPIYGLSKSTPPTLIIHGDADMLVPIQQSQIYIDKLKAEGVDCKLITKPGAGHGWADIIKDVESLVAWVEDHLGKK